MKKATIGIMMLMMSFYLINPAGATLILPGSETSLQTVLNNITVGPTAGVSSVNVNTDQLGYDERWSITATGGSIANIIIELAAWAGGNTFGIYDAADPSRMVTIFDGAANAGTQAAVSIRADGSVFLNIVTDTGVDFTGSAFGYFLNTQNGLFRSQTSLNGDGVYHMVAFQGEGDTVQLPLVGPGTWTSNEYVLAFEDTWRGGDQDYNDMVLMVESVAPVPEPATMLLLGSGLLGLGFFGRRKMKK